MKRLLLLLLLVCLSSSAYSQSNAGIGTTTPNASALLEIQGFTQGVLIPRMTNAQRNAISAPRTGLIIYQTDAVSTEVAAFYYWNGWKWVPWGLTGTVWWTTGNSSTNPSTNFIGTTDSVDFVQRTNNKSRLRLYAPRDIAIISDTNAQALRFLEPSGDGTNYTSIKARTQAYDIPWYLPDTQGGARTILANNGSGVLSWVNHGATMVLATTTVATFSANQDNFSLTDGKTFYRLCGTANYDLTGLAGGIDGRFVIICNVCFNTIRVVQDSPNSLAQNRLLTGGGGTYSLAQDEASLFVYDGVSLRWRITAKTP
jgi:hypothetical protein